MSSEALRVGTQQRLVAVGTVVVAHAQVPGCRVRRVRRCPDRLAPARGLHRRRRGVKVVFVLRVRVTEPDLRRPETEKAL